MKVYMVDNGYLIGSERFGSLIAATSNRWRAV